MVHIKYLHHVEKYENALITKTCCFFCQRKNSLGNIFSKRHYFKEIQLPLQNIFHQISVGQIETQADAAVGTEMTRHGNELAGNILSLDDLFGTQRVTYGCKQNDSMG